MKKALSYLFSLAILITTTSCVFKFNNYQDLKPSQTRITKKYQVSPFESIETNIAANIIFNQENTCKVEAQGPDNYIEHIRISTKDNKLTIKLDSETIRFRNTKKNGVTLIISAPMISVLIQKGVGNIHLKDNIQFKDFSITSNGVGEIHADNLECHSLEIYSNGVGDITLQGQASIAKYYSKGVGDLNVENMKTTEVEAILSGVGDISCHASQRINARSNGVGNIKFYGNPQEKNLTKKGVGSITEK